MKNWYLFPLFLIMLFLSACLFKQNKLIKNYELSNHQIKVVSIESVDSFRPFYANDSLRILELQYDSLLTEKMKSIENQLGSVILKIENTEKELETIENPLMIAAINSRMKLMIIEKNKIETILSIYQTTPEKTQLLEITNRIKYLKVLQDSLLGYTLKISFIGKQGALPNESYQQNYLFNADKTRIEGIIQP